MEQPQQKKFHFLVGSKVSIVFGKDVISFFKKKIKHGWNGLKRKVGKSTSDQLLYEREKKGCEKGMWLTLLYMHAYDIQLCTHLKSRKKEELFQLTPLSWHQPPMV